MEELAKELDGDLPKGPKKPGGKSGIGRLFG
jgi:hypothetical protein